jgi:hypothetical protein
MTPFQKIPLVPANPAKIVVGLKETTVGAMATTLHREILKIAVLKMKARPRIIRVMHREIAPIKIFKELLVTLFDWKPK